MAKQQEINHDNISQKSIRRFLREEELKKSGDFDNLRSSRHLIDNSFLHHYGEFSIEASVDEVWETYLQVPPEETWNMGLISYGFTYDAGSRKFQYSEDEYNGLKEGQILFLNLRMLFGLIDITIMHKVVEINEDEHYLFISYLEKNKSAGTQHISFTQQGDKTLVKHKTLYKSKSSFRDKMVYPFFHSLIIKRFHENILAQVDKKKG